MPHSALQRMSAEEYLHTEETSPYKREYVDGFVYPLHAQVEASELDIQISKLHPSSVGGVMSST